MESECNIQPKMSKNDYCRHRHWLVTCNTDDKDTFCKIYSALIPDIKKQQLGILYTGMKSACVSPVTYPTYKEEVDFVLSLFKTTELQKSSVLDPCCGSKAISKCLDRIDVSCLTMDVAVEHQPDILANFLNPSTYAAHKCVHRRKLLADGSVFSPPFELTYAFAAMALLRVKHFVCMHVPCTDNVFSRSRCMSDLLKKHVTFLVGMDELPNRRGRLGKCMWIVIFKNKKLASKYLKSPNTLTLFK